MRTIVFILGACLGSLINLISIRYANGENFVWGRSHCRNCGTPLGIVDLIPIISFMMLKGKCRHCGKRISRRYLLIELCGGLLSCGMYLKKASAIEYLFVFTLFLIALIDFDSLEIPYFTMFILFFVSVALAIERNLNPIEVIGGVVIISLPMSLISFINNGFGWGDVIVVAISGIGLGYRNSIVAFIVALLFGSLQSLMIIIKGKLSLKSVMPFGTALFVGYSLALIYGQQIIHWYLQLVN